MVKSRNFFTLPASVFVFFRERGPFFLRGFDLGFGLGFGLVKRGLEAKTIFPSGRDQDRLLCRMEA